MWSDKLSSRDFIAFSSRTHRRTNNRNGSICGIYRVDVVEDVPWFCVCFTLVCYSYLAVFPPHISYNLCPSLALPSLKHAHIHRVISDPTDPE
ncbi:hypothetical protein RRG08_053584 [Elysia crispata]|uniref:Uncharacterized protein n=1 Tax=Elysia crispata TaxID=231223 RepID=A0AAE0Y184_9GAST|nr:hypothetical protein RRG08_053584 [Elysia crispata]